MSDLIGRTPVGTTQIVELDASTAQGLDVPSGATFALISIEGAIRWRDDGVPPTASEGHWMVDERMLYGGSLAAVKLIAQSRRPVATISYYR
jgi:hypothetical protein